MTPGASSWGKGDFFQTWVEGRLVFDLARPEDHLWAVGGVGAGVPQRPYLCCVDGAGVGTGE